MKNFELISCVNSLADFSLQANAVLGALENVKLIGNTPGGKTLDIGVEPGFRVHLLTTGLVKMYEGLCRESCRRELLY